MIQDPNTIEAKVKASREAVEASVKHIGETKPTVRTKSSPIAALLEPYTGEIRKALQDGWTAGAIARDLSERGMQFSEDSIRLRIAKMFPQDRTPRARGRRTTPTPGAQSTPPQHRPASSHQQQTPGSARRV